MEAQLYSGLHEIVHLTLNLIPLCLLTRAECGIPWAPEVFLAYSGNFRCWPKADTSSADGRSHTETGIRERKVSGTQGKCRQTYFRLPERRLRLQAYWKTFTHAKAFSLDAPELTKFFPLNTARVQRSDWVQVCDYFWTVVRSIMYQLASWICRPKTVCKFAPS